MMASTMMVSYCILRLLRGIKDVSCSRSFSIGLFVIIFCCSFFTNAYCSTFKTAVILIFISKYCTARRGALNLTCGNCRPGNRLHVRESGTRPSRRMHVTCSQYFTATLAAMPCRLLPVHAHGQQASITFVYVAPSSYFAGEYLTDGRKVLPEAL